MEQQNEIAGRAKMIVDTCKLIQDHTRKEIITSPHQTATLLEVIIRDANRIIELNKTSNGTTE